MAGRRIWKEKALPKGAPFMSASFLSEAFFELSEFFARYFGIGKYLLIRFSRFQHRGGRFKLGFFSGNLFDRCDIRHVCLLREVSAGFPSKVFLEFGEFFGGDLRAEKNSFVRIA
jgi:hypothetical protein